MITSKTVFIDHQVPFAAFTGRTQATLYNFRGEQVWLVAMGVEIKSTKNIRFMNALYVLLASFTQ